MRVLLRWSAEFKACALGVKDFQAHVAQAVEHFLGKEEVTGSSPVVGSSKENVGSSKEKKNYRSGRII